MARSITQKVQDARRDYEACKRARLRKGKKAWPQDKKTGPFASNCRQKYQKWQSLVAQQKALAVASKPAIEAAKAAGVRAEQLGQEIANYTLDAQFPELPELPPSDGYFEPSTPEMYEEDFSMMTGSEEGVPTWAYIAGGVALVTGIAFLFWRS